VADSAEIEHLTDLLRKGDDPFWRRFREMLRARDIDPAGSILAVSFEDGDRVEYGVVVTGDERVFEYGIEFVDSQVEQATIMRWDDITASFRSTMHRGAVETALGVLRKRRRMS
jgi:hypothetical protein